MLLVIFLGVITKLVLVCHGCDFDLPNLNDFDWNQVEIVLLIRIVKQLHFKPNATIYISFVVPLTNPKYSISDRLLCRNWMIIRLWFEERLLYSN
jgi:hypothetical protein